MNLTPKQKHILSRLNLSTCTISEKFDGISAAWDGEKLTTQTGKPIFAPSTWIRENIKTSPVRGELWGGFNTYQKTQSIVMSKYPDLVAWSYIHFMEFEKFQIPITGGMEQVERFYNEVLNRGGEGCIIRIESGKDFKLIPFETDEAQYIGESGKKGSIMVRDLRTGLTFSLPLNGNPKPELGAIVSYAMKGRFKSDMPREPRFLHLRNAATIRRTPNTAQLRRFRDFKKLNN